MARLRLRWTNEKDPRLPEPVRDEIRRRMPEVDEFYRLLGRAQPKPMTLGHVDNDQGFVLFVDDQLGGHILDRTGTENLENSLAAYQRVVTCVEEADRAEFDDDAFASAAENDLRARDLLPDRDVTIRRLPTTGTNALPAGIRVVAACTADPYEDVADPGLFGQPRHVRDGYAGGQAWFIHPRLGTDPADPPKELDAAWDVAPLFEVDGKGDTAEAIVFVEADRGVEIRCPELPGHLIAEALEEYARNGIFERGLGRNRYALFQGSTGTLVFEADASLRRQLAVTLASAWSLAANRGNYFLQGGRAADGAHWFFLTP